VLPLDRLASCRYSYPAQPAPILLLWLAQDDLRRAVEEKVLALDLLASAERKLVEQQAESGGWVGRNLRAHGAGMAGHVCAGVGWCRLPRLPVRPITRHQNC